MPDPVLPPNTYVDPGKATDAMIEKKRDTSGDSELIAKLDGWFEESKSNMEATRNRWRKNEKLYRGEVGISGTDTKLKFNLPLSIVETEMAIITDYLPTFDVMPDDENDIEAADLMQKRKTQIEKRSKLRKAMISACQDHLIYSNGITHIDVDMDSPAKDHNFRNVKASAVDPFTWFPSPDAVGMDIRTDARYHIFAVPVHVDEIKRIHNVNAGSEDIRDYRSYQDSDDKSEEETDMALFKECYYMDEDVEAFPNGRAVFWVGPTIIFDGPILNVTEVDENVRIPYFMVANYVTAHGIIGIGETELVATPTRCLNEVMSATADNIKKTGNPLLRLSQSLFTRLKYKIMGRAGDNVVAEKHELDYLHAPGLPAATFQFLEILIRLTDMVTGVHDVIAGRQPTGVTAASAIIALQEAAQARIRYKIANEITEYVVDIGTMIVWMLKTFDDEVTSIRDRDIVTGEYNFTDYDPRKIRDSKFDVDVVAGTRKPTGRLADEEIALNKFKEGIYGIEEYVQHSTEQDKSQLVQNWYKRQGLAAEKERYDALEKIRPRFSELVLAATEPEFQGSPAEEELADIIAQYPEVLLSEEFSAIPRPIQMRIMAVFLTATNTGESGQSQASIEDQPGQPVPSV